MTSLSILGSIFALALVAGVIFTQRARRLKRERVEILQQRIEELYESKPVAPHMAA